MYRSVRILSIVGLVALAACGPKQAEPVKVQVAADTPREVRIPDSTIARLRMEYEKRQVEELKRFLDPKPTFTKVERIEGVPEGWNDTLCDQYLTLGTLSDAASAPDTAFQQAGVAKVVVEQYFQNAARKFAGEMQKLMLLPKERRQKFDKEWSHTCDGMLRPIDLVQLAFAMTMPLVESGAPHPKITPAFRAVLLDAFRLDYQQTGPSKYDDGHTGIRTQVAYWGFTPAEIGYKTTDVPMSLPDLMH